MPIAGKRFGLRWMGPVLTINFLMVGLFADLDPRPPAGEVVTGTVYTVVPDSLGRPYYVAAEATTSQGPVSCSLGKDSFRDGVLPTVGTRIPIAWTPDHCASGESSEQLPRWFFFVLAGCGVLLTMGLWYGTAD